MSSGPGVADDRYRQPLSRMERDGSPRRPVAPMSTTDPRDAVAAFHELYYDSWSNTYWFGAQTAKCPLDLWIYQEILWETRPDLIVECDTAYGGSTLLLAR